MSAPHTTSAATAASAARPCWRRRIRSVGRAWSEQGSNSADSSSPACGSVVVGLGECPAGLGDPGRVQLRAHLVVAEPLKTAQHTGRPRGPGQRGKALVQGEFIGAARAREQPQAPDLGQQRRELRPLGPGLAPQRKPRFERLAHHPPPHVRIPRVAAGLGPPRRRDQPVAAPSPGPLRPRGSERCTIACAVTTRRLRPRRGRKYEIGEPHQSRVVLDERGLGLLDADGGGGWVEDVLLWGHVQQNERMWRWSPRSPNRPTAQAS